MSERSLSRRSALKQTLGFSAAMLAGKTPLFASSSKATNAAAHHFTMIGDWGKPGNMTLQKAVAQSMTGYLSKRNATPEAMFLLGDNFYGKMPGGVKNKRWQTQFSAVYPPKDFPCPCYAILGNHEYDDQHKIKIDAQLGYAKYRPNTRWSMPAKWYRLDLGPEGNPLMTVLCIDSNFSNRRDQLTPEERAEQLAWVKAELAKPRKAPWLVINGHHPLYSCGHYGDFPEMIAEWDALFRKHKVHFYFCGHEHDLQHLEFADHPTSFVISGGGGAPIREPKKADERGPFVEGITGFTHLEVTPEKFSVRHIDRDEKVLHAFTKTLDGQVEMMS